MSSRSLREVFARAARAAVRQSPLALGIELRLGAEGNLAAIFIILGARPPLNLDAIYYIWLRAPRRSVLNSIQVEGGAPPSVVNSSQVAGGAQPSAANNNKEHLEDLSHIYK